jgi:Rrf2 family protein
MLTRRAKYALKAMLYLARREQGEAVLIAQIATEEGIPQKFLESILLTLKKSGLCTSRKGRGGGYALAKPAASISFGEIVRTMDGPLAPVPCVSVTAYHRCEECRSERSCAIKRVMKQARDAIADVLDSTSLAQALRGAAAPPALRPSRRG